MKYHVSAFSGPENDSFARRSATDSRINIGIGTTAAQKWDVSVFVLSPEGQCDWDDFLAVGATAAPHPVPSLKVGVSLFFHCPSSVRWIGVSFLVLV